MTLSGENSCSKRTAMRVGKVGLGDCWGSLGKLSKRLVIGLIGSLLLLASSALMSTPAEAQFERFSFDEDGDIDILAFGDSYTAGNGTAGPWNVGNDAYSCNRSSTAYPFVLGDILRREGYEVDVKSVACNGNVTHDLNGGGTSGQVRAAVAQKAVEEADLILLTIGGNDLGFSSIATHCLVLLIAPSCEGLIAEARRNLPGTISRLESILEDFHRRAPSAQIILVGYPLSLIHI